MDIIDHTKRSNTLLPFQTISYTREIYPFCSSHTGPICNLYRRDMVSPVPESFQVDGPVLHFPADGSLISTPGPLVDK